MGHTYYVDHNLGSDSNDGATATPFKTVSQAVSSASDGDRIFIRRGLEYLVEGNVSAVTQANPAVLTATAHGLTTGDTVWLAGFQTVASINGPDAGMLTITKIDDNSFSVPVDTSTLVVDGTGTFTTGDPNGYYETVNASSKRLWIEGEDPDTTIIGASGLYALRVGSGSVVKNLGLKQRQGDGFALMASGSNNVLLENCVIDGIGGADGLYALNTNGLIARGCRFYCGYDAIRISGIGTAFYDCEFIAANDGSGTPKCVSAGGSGSGAFYRCRFFGSNPLTDNDVLLGLQVDAGTYHLYECAITLHQLATNADCRAVTAETGGTVNLYDCVINTVNPGSGTAYDEYNDGGTVNWTRCVYDSTKVYTP